ncbi:2'-5' RNA ligase family protein [Angustibacter peucedani]
MTSGPERTIGVAISIPAPYGEQLRALRASFGDPLAASIPTHVTLLPPTEVDPRGTDLVHEHLAKVAAAVDPFDIHLRGTATFRPVSPVVFVPLVRGIGECELLEQAVRSGPLARELQFYYHPHVTVAHHLADDALDRASRELADFECRFRVEGFHLYEHGADGVWRPEGWYPFSVGAPDPELG